jgi:hypothetical protein
MSVDVPVVFWDRERRGLRCRSECGDERRDSSSVLMNSPGIYVVSLKPG